MSSAITIGLIECALENKLQGNFNRTLFRSLVFRCCTSGDIIPSSGYLYLNKNFDKESPFDGEIQAFQIPRGADLAPGEIALRELLALTPAEAANRLVGWNPRLDLSFRAPSKPPREVARAELTLPSLTVLADGKNHRPKPIRRSRRPMMALRRS